MGVDVVISDYTSLDMDTLLARTNVNLNAIRSHIAKSLPSISIRSIEWSPSKLKGGFIADVIGVDIDTAEHGVLQCVLKLESPHETFLSNMATFLQLYKREYDFYEHVSKYVPVKYPECYGLISNQSFRPIGILMKNLVKENYVLNLDLNTQPIDQSLKILDRLARLHATFWNKPLDCVHAHVDWVSNELLSTH